MQLPDLLAEEDVVAQQLVRPMYVVVPYGLLVYTAHMKATAWILHIPKTGVTSLDTMIDNGGLSPLGSCKPKDRHLHSSDCAFGPTWSYIKGTDDWTSWHDRPPHGTCVVQYGSVSYTHLTLPTKA